MKKTILVIDGSYKKGIDFVDTTLASGSAFLCQKLSGRQQSLRHKKDGNSAFLLRQLLSGKEEESFFVDRKMKFSPCIGCGKCAKTKQCVLDDDMQKVYEMAQTAKRVVIVSPIYFGTVTGFVLDVLSRFQQFFGNEFDLLPKVGKSKQGAVILCAGGKGGEITHAEKVAKTFCTMLNVEKLHFITSYKTDSIPANEDKEAIEKIEFVRKEWF